MSQARRPRVIRTSHPCSVLTPRGCRRLMSLREEEDMRFRPAAALKPLPDARPGASYSSRRRPVPSTWQQVGNTPPCTNRKTLGGETAEMGLSCGLSATDRNQRQEPRRPRNDGVSGSHPLVGSYSVTGCDQVMSRCAGGSRAATNRPAPTATRLDQPSMDCASGALVITRLATFKLGRLSAYAADPTGPATSTSEPRSGDERQIAL